MSAIPPNRGFGNSYSDNEDDLTENKSIGARSIADLSDLVISQSVASEADAPTPMINTYTSPFEPGYTTLPASYLPHQEAARRLNELHSSAIDRLPADEVNKLSPQSVAGLKSWVLNLLRIEALQKLEPHVLNHLNPGALSKLSSTVLLNLSPDTIAQLEPRVLNNLNRGVIEALDIGFMRNLSDQTSKGLAWHVINGLSDSVLTVLDERPFNRSPLATSAAAPAQEVPNGLFRAEFRLHSGPTVKVLQSLPVSTLQKLQIQFIHFYADDMLLGLDTRTRTTLADRVAAVILSQLDAQAPIPRELTAHILVSMSPINLCTILSTLQSLDKADELHADNTDK